MSIKIRFALLLGTLLVMFAAALQILRHEEREEAANLSSQSIRENELSFRSWLELINQPIKKFAQDYAGWNEMAEFVAKPDPVWAEKNLKQNLSRYQIHAVWVLNAEGQIVHSAQTETGGPLPPPLPPTNIVSSTNAPTGIHAFADSRDGLLEIWSKPIQSDLAKGGWLIAARLWNADFLTTLGRLTESNLQLMPVAVGAKSAEAGLGFRLPLDQVDGTHLRQLHVNFAPPAFADSLVHDTFAVKLLLGFAVLVVVAVWLAAHRWMVRPLGRISESLVQEDVGPVRSLMQDTNELGRVARLVASSFVQQRALEREIEEHKRSEISLRLSEERVRQASELHARLARDLHDGVIQSIYAAGLGLECAMTQLDTEQPTARTRLQHCRQSLNNIIRDVRGFIDGLEPEQTPHRGFAEELSALAGTMQGLSPVEITLHIDPAAAAQLSASQQIHALQIVRESISNALRHGEARKIVITLKPVESNLRFSIHDDGRGLASNHATSQGRGLHNISIRAREMGGTLQLNSQPGKGVEVIVTFAITKPAA